MIQAQDAPTAPPLSVDALERMYSLMLRTTLADQRVVRDLAPVHLDVPPRDVDTQSAGASRRSTPSSSRMLASVRYVVFGASEPVRNSLLRGGRRRAGAPLPRSG